MASLAASGGARHRALQTLMGVHARRGRAPQTYMGIPSTHGHATRTRVGIRVNRGHAPQTRMGIDPGDPYATHPRHGNGIDRNPNAPRPHGRAVLQPGASRAVDRAERQAIAADRPHGPAGGPHPGPRNHTPPNSPHGTPHGGGGGGGGGGKGPQDFMGMLSGLLGQADTAHGIPTALADKIAGVDTATAQGYESQLDHLPAAKKAALQSIANWFGQVVKGENTAASRDQSIAGAGSRSIGDATKGIMASLGGSAMPGSGEIGAMGANDANTLAAMGANDKMLASDLGPIFKLAEANAKNSRAQQYDQAKSDLQTSMAQAQGQAETDRANALMQILQANNASRQSNFSNQAGLLNTLASLQISGMNAASTAQYRGIENALHQSEIQKNLSKGTGGLAAMTPTERADFVNKIVGALVDPNSGKLKSGLGWQQALRDARNFARTAGMNPLSRQVIGTVIGPALSQAGITGNGPNGFWPAIYQP